jgi:hypothetical protein
VQDTQLDRTDIFDLPDRLAAKAQPALIAQDERHLAEIGDSLASSIADLSARLDAERKMPARKGTQAVERDDQVKRLESRLRTLRRYGLDMCLGAMVTAEDPTPVYVGRLGLTDDAGRRLLVDWRSPSAAPFFSATRADPMGLVRRRRYRWTRGRITDYWDELFGTAAVHDAAPDEDSALLAGLGAARSGRMRDVLGTIAAEQDRIIRAESPGTLVVDGGPGTGKTVVALHRAAYLLYADPRLGPGRGGVLVVGPSQPYLAYVEDVLPSLGEDGVRTCTIADLVAEGAAAGPEPDPAVSALKSTARMVGAIDAAIRFHQEPPTDELEISTPLVDVVVEPADWADAFEAPEPGTPHNEARQQIRDALLDRLADRYPDDAPQLRRGLRGSRELTAAINRAWPLLSATDLVGDLWSVPAYLRLCAPWLSPSEVRSLQRSDSQAWTIDDLPLLDAARRLLGDADTERRTRERETLAAQNRARMDSVVDDLLASRAHDDGEGLMSMLVQQDLRDALVDETVLPTADLDELAGPFAHIVVDEAQELTDAQWQMLLQRCPSASFTVVGDRAQARHGFPESWTERLHRIGLRRIATAGLTINYRTPEEVMRAAEPVIRAVMPDANVPRSIRSNGIPVRYGSVDELPAVLARWADEQPEGIACVLGAPGFAATPRVASLTPELAKGLEFDLVVLVDPESFGDGIQGAVDRYVAMTRTTQRLVVLS